MQGKYSKHITESLTSRKQQIETAAMDFVQKHADALALGWVEVRDDGSITAREIATEICTDVNFQRQDIPGDYRDPGSIKVRYEEKIWNQSDR
jgi:hypothetical protein